jgi:HTH-type transcriptional regulator, competence development regulator
VETPEGHRSQQGDSWPDVHHAVHSTHEGRRTGPGALLRATREARRVGIEPNYLSKVERAEVSQPSEETLRGLAA